LKKEKLDIEEKNIINENILYNEQNPNFIKKERLNNEEKQKIIEILKKVNVHIAK
jgi:hypothetical protein